MNTKEHKPFLSSQQGAELCLRGEDLAILARAVLEKGLPFRFRAQGMSMFPFIRDGDVITIHPLTNKQFVRGDIVACVLSGSDKLAIHRIVGKKGDSYLIKGDNNVSPDGLISKENLLGYLVRIERSGKDCRFGLKTAKRLAAFLNRTNIIFRFVRMFKIEGRFCREN